MKYYIMTITFNFDGDYLAKHFSTYEEAVTEMNKCLEKEIKYVTENCGYKPSVLDWAEDNVTLVYAEGYSLKNIDVNYRKEDCAEYNVFEVEI